MSPGATPGGPGGAGRASTPDGSASDAAPVEHSAEQSADRPAEQPAEQPAEPSEEGSVPASELPARVERRRRLQALAGVTVRGSDGKTVGRVRDVYLHDATGELAALTVMPRQLSARSVLIPASAIAALPEAPEDAAADHAPAPRGAPTTPAAPTPADGDAAEQGGDHVLQLLVDTATAKAGAPPPVTLHITPEGLQEAVAALHLGEGPAPV